MGLTAFLREKQGHCCASHHHSTQRNTKHYSALAGDAALPMILCPVAMLQISKPFFFFFLEDHNLPFSTLVCFRQDCGNHLESQLDGIVSDGKTGE